MKYLYLIVLIFSLNVSYAQHLYDNNWFFCYARAFDGAEDRVKFDFRNAPPATAEGTTHQMEHFLTSAIISNSQGDLLFYTNGCWIANRNHELMLNGDGLNAGQVANSNCRGLDGNYPSKDGALILPQPDNDSLYYLFHLQEFFTDTFVGAIGIYYTLINMKLDGGLGGVVEKNVPMEEDWVWNEELKAVRHANNRDWWIIIQDRPETDYLRWLLTPDGLEGPFRQPNDSPVPHPLATGSGYVGFSPDGLHYVRNLRWMDILLYDVDRATGELNNRRILMKKSDTTNFQEGGGGVAFSPSGRFVYANSVDTVWQWDLEATNIAASRTVVGIYDGFGQGTNFRSDFLVMRLGYDCRIYIVPPHNSRYMHVINWPDRAGAACEVVQRAYKFDCFHGSTMPNFAHYRLGTGLPACDMSLHSVSSTVTATQQPYQAPPQSLDLWPNPASSQLHIAIPAQAEAGSTLTIHDSYGRVVHTQPKATEQQLSVSVSGFASGIYIAVLRSLDGRVWRERVMIR